jgi:hypothetical protein
VRQGGQHVVRLQRSLCVGEVSGIERDLFLLLGFKRQRPTSEWRHQTLVIPLRCQSGVWAKQGATGDITLSNWKSRFDNRCFFVPFTGSQACYSASTNKLSDSSLYYQSSTTCGSAQCGITYFAGSTYSYNLLLTSAAVFIVSGSTNVMPQPGYFTLPFMWVN